MKYQTRILAAALALGALASHTAAEAQRAGAATSRAAGPDGTRQVRNGATGNVNRADHSSTNINNSGNRTNINTGDINIDRDVEIDIDVDNGWGYGWDDHHHYHPVAAVAATAAVTAAVVGTYYRTLPANCMVIYRSSVTYYQCGTTWYQPVYYGSSVQYVVVVAP